jgi:hypothetical protein
MLKLLLQPTHRSDALVRLAHQIKRCSPLAGELENARLQILLPWNEGQRSTSCRLADLAIRDVEVEDCG